MNKVGQLENRIQRGRAHLILWYNLKGGLDDLKA